MDRKLLINAVRVSRAIGSGPLDEAAYLALWQSHVTPIEDPFMRSVVGGIFADRLAWVFVAGYQLAVRSVFSVESDRWVAYVASEDRSGTLPAVSVMHVAGETQLTGWKTWVAAVDHVGELVVRTNGAQAEHYLVSRESTGLTLSAKADVSFLGDLSQGSAEFSGVVVQRQLQVIDEVPFNLREALAIYGALCGLVLAQPMLEASSESCLDLLDIAAGLWATSLCEPNDIQQLKSFDQNLQGFIASVEDDLAATIPDWDRDRRLVSMYSPGIARYSQAGVQP